MIESDVQKLDPGSVVELYIVDTSQIKDINGAPGQLDYFHNGVNELGNDVVWDGDTYIRLPIKAEGFATSSTGTFPRPKIGLSNIGGFMGALARQYNDFLRAKVTRIRTFVHCLDAVNFADGNVRADPNSILSKDVYSVDRKSLETSQYIEFELSAAWDLVGVKLPRRVVVKRVCPWLYRGGECGYTGGAVADLNDNPTSDLAADTCGKRVASCRLRNPPPAPLPFGGFPNVGRSYS